MKILLTKILVRSVGFEIGSALYNNCKRYIECLEDYENWIGWWQEQDTPINCNDGLSILILRAVQHNHNSHELSCWALVMAFRDTGSFKIQAFH